MNNTQSNNPTMTINAQQAYVLTNSSYSSNRRFNHSRINSSMDELSAVRKPVTTY